jgi:hypothetical protein
MCFTCASLFMTYHQLYNKSNSMGANSGTGTAYPSGDLISSPVFSGVRIGQSLVFCIVFRRSLFLLLSFFFLVIALSVLRFTASYYPLFWHDIA